MVKSDATMARQIALAASEFELRRTGHGPQSVSVILSGDTLVITLHGALSPAEQALAGTSEGAEKLQEFHRQLFLTSSDSLRTEIQRITGVKVREAAAQIDPVAGSVLQVFTTGTTVQIFLLAGNVPSDHWSDRDSLSQR